VIKSEDLEINSDYSNNITKILNEYNEEKDKGTSEYLTVKTHIFLRSILNKSNVIITGNSSSGKSDFIKICGHIFSKLMSKIQRKFFNKNGFFGKRFEFSLELDQFRCN